MSLLLAGVALLVLGGVASLLAGDRTRLASALALGGLLPGSVAGLVGAAAALGGAPAVVARVPSSLPFGDLLLRLDPLAALFLLVLFTVAPLAGVFGAGYLDGTRRALGPLWLLFALLVAGIALVLLAADAVAFLLAWEVMSLAGFFLVTHDDESAEVRSAGWTYLVATHVGTAALVGFFLVAGRGGVPFAAMEGVHPPGGVLHGAAFLLAVLGFGLKAGFYPLHGWLPEAHSAAPSHVSALMSGVMIKVGIYGLLRAMTILGGAQIWWGWLLVGVGAASGVLGVLFALAQHDLKRLLAYHSVENVGIITLGLGLGVLGCASGHPPLAFLGLAGALFHVVNHALFKSLLFLGAGSVLHATGTREIDLLGGLAKPLRATAATFLLGAVAIAGLPPLNGFASELLIVLAAVAHGAMGPQALAVPALVTVVALALIGGLAAACFAKAYGAVFLGVPRSAAAEGVHESGRLLVVPMVVLAALCVLSAAAAAAIVAALAPAVGVIGAGLGLAGLESAGRPATAALGPALVAGGVLLGVVLVLALLRRALLAGREVRPAATWGCGYLAPSARMQYTASSFAQPLVELFAPLLRTRRRLELAAGVFPTYGRFTSHTADVATDLVIRPAFTLLAGAFGRLRFLQHGRVQLYVAYIALTLLALLAWNGVRS